MNNIIKEKDKTIKDLKLALVTVIILFVSVTCFYVGSEQTNDKQRDEIKILKHELQETKGILKDVCENSNEKSEYIDDLSIFIKDKLTSIQQFQLMLGITNPKKVFTMAKKIEYLGDLYCNKLNQINLNKK